MSKLNDRHWLEIEHFFTINKTHNLTEKPYHDSKSQTRLSRFEIFPESKKFCNKPTPLYTTQKSDFFITYKEGFNMHTRNAILFNSLKMNKIPKSLPNSS